MSGQQPQQSHQQGVTNNSSQGGNNPLARSAPMIPLPPHVMHNQLPPHLYGSALPAHIPYGGIGSQATGPARHGGQVHMNYGQMYGRGQANMYGQGNMYGQARVAIQANQPEASTTVSQPQKKELKSKLSM